jgi:hypothetical protein
VAAIDAWVERKVEERSAQHRYVAIEHGLATQSAAAGRSIQEARRRHPFGKRASRWNARLRLLARAEFHVSQTRGKSAGPVQLRLLSSKLTENQLFGGS